MIKYNLNENGIFHVIFSDTISLDDIKAFLLEFEKLKNLPKNLLTLYDLRGAVMDLSLNDIAFIAKLTEKATASYKTVKTAFLVDSPNLTAYSILFTKERVPGKTKREVFSTEKAALQWL